MNKSTLRSQITLTATLFLLMIAAAAYSSEKELSTKPRLVLMPLQADANDKNMPARIEAALTQELAQQYEVIAGKRVLQSLKKSSAKLSRAARKKGCDETDCLKYMATDLHAEIFATVRVTKSAEEHVLSLVIKNIMTNQTVLENTLPCKGCDQSQLANKLKELVQPPTAVATLPTRPLEPGDIFKDCADCPDMVVIPSGSFDMGSISSEEKDERPEHRVVFIQPFAMGETEITRGQFEAFVSASGYAAGEKCWMLVGDGWEERSGNWRNPGYPQDNNHPVACINWIDAQAYVKWLSLQTGKTYQLPSESQWEYACRAGERIEYCGNDNADHVAWYDQNSGRTTHLAATKHANSFRLYDMSGNVGEWIEDSYHNRYSGAPTNGSAWPGDNSKRVLRGGSWLYSHVGIRSAFRSVSAPEYRYFDSGFRVVRTLP